MILPFYCTKCNNKTFYVNIHYYDRLYSQPYLNVHELKLVCTNCGKSFVVSIKTQYPVLQVIENE